MSINADSEKVDQELEYKRDCIYSGSHTGKQDYTGNFPT